MAVKRKNILIQKAPATQQTSTKIINKTIIKDNKNQEFWKCGPSRGLIK